MDELLDFMENDTGAEVTGDVDNFCTSSGITVNPLKPFNSSSTTPPPSSFRNQKVTFNEVFGSPDKRDVKELGLLQAAVSCSRSPSSLNCSSSSSDIKGQLNLSKAIRQDSNVPYQPKCTTVLDPFSRIRLLKSSISIYYDESMTAEMALKDRNLGLEYVNLSSFPSWHRGKGKDQKNFWICGALVRKTAGVRKSSNGNEYTMWELNDLKDLNNRVKVFLFGSAGSSSSSRDIPVGSLVDLATPSVMQDSGGEVKFSVNNALQVRFIAKAQDFGHCTARKKNGDKCTAVVNTWECSFCIYHAASELKKINASISSGKKRNGGVRGTSTQSKVVVSRVSTTPSSRMALQGGVNQMNKNPLKFGNPETVKFVASGNKEHMLLKNDPRESLPVRKPLDLNPTKTRHLTDKDRDLLCMLEGKATGTSASDGDLKKCENKNKKFNTSSAEEPVISELITTSIVTNPTAASRNFLQFLSLQHAPKDQVDLKSSHKSSKIQPLTMSRAKVKSMEKALDFVKNNGPIQKANPNYSARQKRKRIEDPSTLHSETRTSKKPACSQVSVEFDFDAAKMKGIIEAKSAHEEELDKIEQDEYFAKLETKEAVENKLLNTFSIETSAVMCRQCKYVALSQSDFCKERLHQVRLVKAQKRFFKCKDCGNRTMSLDRLPKQPCSNCKNSCWLSAPVGKERKGPTLPSEVLAVRGNEEKFVGSAGGKLFMHLEV